MKHCGAEFSFKTLADMLDAEIHALAQPLTSLQCRLEIGCLATEDGGVLSTVHDSLVELKRVFAAVERMRVVVATLSSSEKGGQIQ